jgi:hypothetical protein
MYNIKRRQFMQFASSTLATIGLSQLDIIQQGERYAKVLAQNTPRKLALLVGINDYLGKVPPLQGCVNDTDMQRELLISRFGFKPADIHTLTNAEATRQNILTSFEEHLIKQAKPGDIVVFHFSGHGSRVSDKPSCDEIALNLSKQCANSTILPVDARKELGKACDIMGHTLFLLTSALKTENVTVILDSCYSGGGHRGNFLVRSTDDQNLLVPCPEELAYQRQWLEKLLLTPQQFIDLRRKNIAKGVAIASAKRDQLALDGIFNNFNAGAFSYLFTQYLWQQFSNESLRQTIINVTRSTKNKAAEKYRSQDPELDINLSQKNANPSVYFTASPAFPAEAVVTKVDGNKVDFWLGGIDWQSLEAFKNNAVFSILDANGKEQGLIKLDSRKGLLASGIIDTTRATLKLAPGTLLQERIRNVPSDLTLKIGLDDELDGDNAAQIKQALQAIPRIEALPLTGREVQYIFGRMTESKHRELQKRKVSNLPNVGSLGLFLPSLDDIIPASFGDAKESANAAVMRLQPRLKSLLATKFVRCITGNTNTSRLAISALFTVTDTKKVISEAVTLRGLAKAGVNKPASPTITTSSAGIPQLKVKTQVMLQIKNNESLPLFISILVIDAQGEMGIIFPVNWSDAENAAVVGAGETLATGNLEVQEPFGTSEVLIIASTKPLRSSLKVLREIAQIPPGKRRNAAQSDNFLNLTNTLLDDLEASTRNAIDVQGIELPPGTHGVDTQKLAAMAIAFEVVS